MESNKFEEAFEKFLDRREYDEAQAVLFDIVRMAFEVRLTLIFYTAIEVCIASGDTFNSVVRKRTNDVAKPVDSFLKRLK